MDAIIVLRHYKDIDRFLKIYPDSFFKRFDSDFQPVFTVPDFIKKDIGKIKVAYSAYISPSDCYYYISGWIDDFMLIEYDYNYKLKKLFKKLGL